MEEIKYLFSLSRRLGVNIVDGPVTFLLSAAAAAAADLTLLL